MQVTVHGTTLIVRAQTGFHDNLPCAVAPPSDAGMFMEERMDRKSPSCSWRALERVHRMIYAEKVVF